MVDFLRHWMGLVRSKRPKETEGLELCGSLCELLYKPWIRCTSGTDFRATSTKDLGRVLPNKSTVLELLPDSSGRRQKETRSRMIFSKKGKACSLATSMAMASRRPLIASLERRALNSVTNHRVTIYI